MDDASLLVTAMAAQCQSLIGAWDRPDPTLPPTVQPKHLLWMCRQVEKHAEQWSPTKLHRWIGFIQCGMLAHRMIDLDGAKAMFDASKVAHGARSEDLVDHLDPASSFTVDIGGQG